jgi:hypothetical protein
MAIDISLHFLQLSFIPLIDDSPYYVFVALCIVVIVVSQSVLETGTDHRHNIIFYSTYQYSLYYSSFNRTFRNF